MGFNTQSQTISERRVIRKEIAFTHQIVSLFGRTLTLSLKDKTDVQYGHKIYKQ